MSCKYNSSLTEEQILMKLYTVLLYDLRLYMKEAYSSSNYICSYFKGDNLFVREMVYLL